MPVWPLKLTGWKIDIKSESQREEAEAELRGTGT